MGTREPLRDDPIGLARDNWCASGWSDAAEGMAIVTSIMRVQQILLADVEAALKPFGLTFARYEVLMLLRFARRRSLPVGRIGARLQVHPASVTNAVDRLELDGLAKRTQNPRDGRSVLASLTPAGAKVAGGNRCPERADLLGPTDVGRRPRQAVSTAAGRSTGLRRFRMNSSHLL